MTMRNKTRVFLAVVFISLLSVSICPADEASFARVKKNDFIVNGENFKFIGANAVNLVFYDDWGLDAEKAIREAKDNNISVLRLYLDWGWGKIEDYDTILELASKYGVYVILVLTDCCCSCDSQSLEDYFKKAPFCNVNDRQAVKAFKNRVKELLERKNHLNGKLYKDDPVIFAWEVANELEYWHFSESEVKNWIKELAGYIKSIDRNHLVTIGIGTDNSKFDKGGELYGLFNIPELDFYSLHFYPSSSVSSGGRLAFKSDYARQIKFRIKKFISMGKPVIMEEFGLSNSSGINDDFRSKQPEFYNSVFKKIMDTSFSSGASGVMFWGWGVPEEKRVPMWWSNESHSQADNRFCEFIKEYKISPGK